MDDAAAGRIAAGIGAPVALKAVSPDLLHKTDAGGVVLGVDPADASAPRRRRCGPRVGMPLDGVFVERMAASGGVDLVVGARRDPTFGPVVLVGVGGIFVETLDDVDRRRSRRPIPAHVAALLRTLRAWPLLAGARGAEPVDVAAVARAACAIGDVLAGRPDLAEIEVNPLRATADGVIALGRADRRGMMPGQWPSGCSSSSRRCCSACGPSTGSRAPSRSGARCRRAAVSGADVARRILAANGLQSIPVSR